MTDLDAILADPRWSPRRGWHDDHRHHDGTPAYLPAMMQVRQEFIDFLEVCAAFHLGASVLQLGMGECDASHEVWRARFNRVVTIDWRVCRVDDGIVAEILPGSDTRSRYAISLASANAPYDLVFIDAGHSLDDVQHDYLSYGAMLRPGGIVAMHDAIPRPAYPEVGVPAFVATLPHARIIGEEVGIAWVERE